MKEKIVLLVTMLVVVALTACAPAGSQAPATPSPAPTSTAVPDTPTGIPDTPTAVSTETATPLPTAEPTETATAEPEATGACPEPTAETQLLKNPEADYCLLYPSGYQAVLSDDGHVDIVLDSFLNVEDPRAAIDVSDAVGRTIEDAADQIEADYGVPGMSVERTTTTVAGEPAIVLDNLSGQDINRRVVFAHEGKLYELFFTPTDPGQAERYAAMEAFYETILSSFTFAPAEALVVTAEDLCPTPTDETQLLRNDDQGYCFLYPDEYTVEQGSDTSTNLFVDSKQNVENPRLFVDVLDAAGRTSEEAAEAIVTEDAPPGYEVQRTFGLLVGGKDAFVLENMPGQDISRQVIVVNGDRAYRLTFVPADEAAGDVFTQMEELYTLVTRSFRFLPSSAQPPDVGDIGEPVLVWEGEGEASGGEGCQSLVVTANNQALIGPCGAATTAVALGATGSEAWSHLVDTVAPFEYETDGERVTFAGSGTETDPAWQRAIISWARYTHGELATGRASASVRTVMSWWLGEADEAGYCKHLVVLSHGYAYANVDRCEGGGTPQRTSEGWLTTSELAQLDTFLYERSSYSDDNNYLTGAGEQPLTDAEVETVSEWAEAVYERLAG